MKTPRVQDFDPTAKVPQLGSPMDNMPSIQRPEKKPESVPTRKEESLKGSGDEIRKSGNPENLLSGNQEIPKTRKEDIPKRGYQEIPISGNPDILNTRKQDTLKVPKYYTQLPLALQDEIKVYAIRHKLNDYEVVIQAVEEFLKKQR